MITRAEVGRFPSASQLVSRSEPVVISAVPFTRNVSSTPGIRNNNPTRESERTLVRESSRLFPRQSGRASVNRPELYKAWAIASRRDVRAVLSCCPMQRNGDKAMKVPAMPVQPAQYFQAHTFNRLRVTFPQSVRGVDKPQRAVCPAWNPYLLRSSPFEQESGKLLHNIELDTHRRPSPGV